MSFPRYPEYKDSGVEWLGEVPGHRSICALKRIADLKSGESITAEDIEEDGEFPVFGGNGLRGFTTCYTHEGAYALIGRQGALCGNINYATGKFWASEHAVVATPKVAVETHWLGELMRAMNLNQYSVSAAQPGLSVEIVGNLRIPVPPAPEQTAIATFLDRETAKIDALVAEQEKLIALLQEKRQAVISHAVTKGLDPNVPMKDSGVEWLGEVPGHWEVCALRRVIAAIEQGWSPECYAREAEDQEWGVLKAGCLNGGIFRPSENKALPPELPPEVAYEVRVGDVLMSRASGSPELVGSTALVKATREQLMLSDKIFRLKLKGFINAAFFVAALNSRPLRIQIENALSGGNGMANNLPQSSLLTFAMAVPPMAEQATITVFLEQETAKLDTLMTEARTAITLLQERRTALISAAVTGQIDVRGLLPDEKKHATISKK